MESTTSSLVTRLGGGSGIDMIQLANDLAEARFVAQIARYTSRSEALEAQISAASTLRSQLSQLASALGDRVRTGDLAPQAQLSNPAIADVRVQAGAVPSGSFSLEVTQLAASQTLVLGPYTSGNDLVGEGTFTLRFGTVNGATFSPDTGRASIDLAVGPADTLADLAARLNGADGGITAYVALGANGAQLVLKGAEGQSNGFVVETSSTSATPTSQPGDLTFLAYDPASDTGQLRQSAQDAVFLLDTVEITSVTNSVTGLPGGLSLDLKATNALQPTRISFTDRSSAISTLMGDFVAALNDISLTLRESAAAIGGELGNDPGARALKRALSGLSSLEIMPGAPADAPRTLGELGLATNRDGTFSFDQTRLDRALERDAAAVSAMFTTGVFGVFATVDDLARGMALASDPGSLAGSITRYTQQTKRIDDRLAKITEQQQALQEQLVKQFTAADRAIALSNSTLDFLRAQVALSTGQNNG